MCVGVAVYPGSGYLPEVNADVEASGFENTAHYRCASPNDAEVVHQLIICHIFQGGDMAVGRHHQVARIVRELVQDHEIQSAAVQNEIALVIVLCRFLTEDTIGGFLGEDEFHAPRRPHMLHVISRRVL
jgi:hypothetical protein